MNLPANVKDSPDPSSDVWVKKRDDGAGDDAEENGDKGR